MTLALNIPSAVLNGLSIALLAYWSVAIYKLVRTLTGVPTLPDGLKAAAAVERWPSVSIVVPAHNEEVSIAALVRSLKAQEYPQMSVVLCLDRCTDRTAEIARGAIAGDERFQVLEIAECPADWAGKVHAIWRGVQTPAAQGADSLLFADADTVFEEGCLRAAVALAVTREAALLSVLSTLSTDRWFERLIQPVATIEIVRQYPILRANKPPGTQRRPFANGQFMLFERAAYDALGGHAAVRDEILEDIALARAAGEAGMRTSLVLAKGLLRCRMYESYDAFRRGWKRIYTECAKCKAGRMRRAALVLRAFYTVLPLAAMANLVVSLSAGAAGLDEADWRANVYIAGAALGAWFVALVGAYRSSGTPLWALPGSMVGAWITADLLSEAARDLRNRVPMTWAGRQYVREPR